MRRSRPSTASATAIARAEPGAEAAPWREARRWISPLTKRILAVNVVALAILVAGLMYLGQYKRGLVAGQVEVLRSQGRLFAIALGQNAVSAEADPDGSLQPEAARHLVRSLAEPTGARIQVFSVDGVLIADSRRIAGPGGTIEIEELSDEAPAGGVEGLLVAAYNWVAALLPGSAGLERSIDAVQPQAEDYPEVMRALAGELASAERQDSHGRLVLSVAGPIQQYRRVMGAILLSSDSSEIDRAMRSVRLDILKVFVIALAVTVLLSVYLAGAIARPIHRLALAAERVRHGRGREVQIPDLTRRQDEIGELSGALRDMTDALWARLDAIERFAADVAHEIKNPLTSLRSAVETAARVDDRGQQQRLMTIILEDVHRLDRLISDISDASRLDAELSRGETETVDIARMLEALAEMHAATQPDGARVVADSVGSDSFEVAGIEGRLVQVFRNLLSNAVSFSPPGGTIALKVSRRDGWVVVTVEDEGPGIPSGKETAIFDRFYTERPEGEKFGTHSGLGLSISRQIIEAHGGTIAAENRLGPAGERLGARFTVRIPALAAASRRGAAAARSGIA